MTIQSPERSIKSAGFDAELDLLASEPGGGGFVRAYVANMMRDDQTDDGVQYGLYGHSMSLFALPDIPTDGSGDIHTIRPADKELLNGSRSEERLFVKVPQGYSLEIPQSEKPFFYLTLSTCSAIIAYGNDTIEVAHISYSLTEQADAVFERLTQKGYTLNNIIVVASEGDRECWAPYVSDGDEYVWRYGVQPDNVVRFTSQAADGAMVIAEVTVDSDGLRVAQWGYDQGRLQAERASTDLPRIK